MLVSALDIGSNTIKITIFDFDGATLREQARKTVNAGLIGYVTNRQLSDEGYAVLERSINILKAFAEDNGCDVQNIHAFATASLRGADNACHVADKIYRSIGIKIDLIDGKREAELSFRSFTQAKGVDISRAGLMIDMGGGSTELIQFSEGGKIVSSCSLDFGALILYRKFVRNILPTKQECETIYDHVLSFLKCGSATDNIYINGGSGRSAVAIFKALGVKTGELPCTLERSEILSLIKDIVSCDARTKQVLLSEIPARIHVMTPALVAMLAILDNALATQITVTDASIREGYILDKISNRRMVHG